MDLIFYMLPSQMSFDDEKKMFKDLIWTTENHMAVQLLFSSALTLPWRKHTFRLKLLKLTEVSLRIRFGHRKKSFKFHSSYSLPLLYRLKWVVPLGRERGSWVLEVYHKWEVCEQSLSMRLRFVLHHFLKAICKEKYTPYNCTKGEKSSTCLIITLGNASTSGLSLTSWSPFDIFPLSHISFVAHTTEKSFF